MKTRLLMSIAILTTLTACAAGVKTTTDETAKTYTFGTPTSFSVTSMNKNNVVVSYDYNAANDAGYNIYFGLTSDVNGGEGLNTSPIHTDGNVLTVGVPENTLIYFAVSALKADGTESAKTSVASITAVPIEADQKQHTVSGHIEACVSQLDKLTLKEGRMFLSYHQDGSDYPGQSKDCDISGIRLHTTEHIQIDKDGDGVIENDDANPDADEVYDISRAIPAISSAPWSPTFEGDSLDLAIYKIVTTKPMLITEFSTISKHCVTIGTSKVEAKLENDEAGVPNTVVMDATDCSSEDGMNFLDGDKGTINFTMTYTSDE